MCGTMLGNLLGTAGFATVQVGSVSDFGANAVVAAVVVGGVELMPLQDLLLDASTNWLVNANKWRSVAKRRRCERGGRAVGSNAGCDSLPISENVRGRNEPEEEVVGDSRASRSRGGPTGISDTYGFLMAW